MAHDFAKKGKATKKKKTKKKSQTPDTSWRSFGSGLVVGIILGPLLYLAMVADSNPDRSADSANDTPVKTAKPEPSSLNKLKNQIEFEFYDILQQEKTGIAVEPEPARESKKSDRRYMLQAGSFRKLADADQLRAELIMLGLSNTKINTVARSNSTWHRVQIGPYESKRALNQARNVLSRNGTDSLVLSVKK